MEIAQYFKGYCIIRIEGDGIEAFTNGALRRNIPLWGINEIKKGVWQGKTHLETLESLRHLAYHYSVYFSVEKNVGLPQWYRRLKKHWFSVAVVIVVLASLVLYSQSILQVKVISDEEISLQEKAGLLQIAAKHGIAPGFWRQDTGYDEALEEMIAENDDIAWVGFQKNGVILHIKVILKDKPPQNTALKGDIVAKKDGILREVLVLKGTGQLAVNTPVQKGDVIISGTVYETDPEGNSVGEGEFVQAKGVVKGSVWYIEEVYEPLSQIKLVKTGKYANSMIYRKNGKEMMLWGSKNHSFQDFTVEDSVWDFKGGSGFTLEIVSEVTPRIDEITKEEAIALATKKAMAKMKMNLPKSGKILDKKVEVLEEKTGAVGVRVTIETKENLGVFQGFQEDF